MAWAILRGRDEEATRVVVRVSADPARYAAVSVTGVDPFTRATRTLVERQAIGGSTDVVLPRARFADTPRTEWRFFSGREPRSGEAAALLVFYQGVPDTAPEFADTARLESYLAERIVRVKAGAEGKRP
jgi:hypothetical protein